MIIGDTFLADGAREAFGEVPFTWVLDHPSLLHHDYTGRVLISTPIIVGTIARLEAEYPDAEFAYMPENVREAHPEDWTAQARFIVGTRAVSFRPELAALFKPIRFMSPESAEMVKHALNGFLALSIRYGMDVADACKRVGADPIDVAFGMMSDPRIGIDAYLLPKGREIGPNLQREVDNLHALGVDL